MDVAPISQYAQWKSLVKTKETQKANTNPSQTVPLVRRDAHLEKLYKEQQRDAAVRKDVPLKKIYPERTRGAHPENISKERTAVSSTLLRPVSPYSARHTTYRPEERSAEGGPMNNLKEMRTAVEQSLHVARQCNKKFEANDPNPRQRWPTESKHAEEHRESVTMAIEEAVEHNIVDGFDVVELVGGDDPPKDSEGDFVLVEYVRAECGDGFVSVELDSSFPGIVDEDTYVKV